MRSVVLALVAASGIGGSIGVAGASVRPAGDQSIAPHYLDARTPHKFVSLIVAGGTVRDLDVSVLEKCDSGAVNFGGYNGASLAGPIPIAGNGSFTATQRFNEFSSDGITLQGRLTGAVVTGTFTITESLPKDGGTCTAQNVAFTAPLTRPRVFHGHSNQTDPRTRHRFAATVATLNGAIDELTVGVDVSCKGGRFQSLALDDVRLSPHGRFSAVYQPGDGPFGPSADVSGRVRGRVVTGEVRNFYFASPKHLNGACPHAPVKFTARR